jgi:hypothetical protein
MTAWEKKLPFQEETRQRPFFPATITIWWRISPRISSGIMFNVLLTQITSGFLCLPLNLVNQIQDIEFFELHVIRLVVLLAVLDASIVDIDTIARNIRLEIADNIAISAAGIDNDIVTTLNGSIQDLLSC